MFVTGGKEAAATAILRLSPRAAPPLEQESPRGLLKHLEVRLLSPLQRPVLLQTATLLGVFLLGFGYFWLLVPNLEARLQQLGLFCSVFTISMYLSPLADLVSGGVVQGSGGGKTGQGPIARDCM